jgi:hypothetical protein
MTSGTFKFSLDTSVWNNTIPIVNTSNSFTTLNITTTIEGITTIVSVQYEYTTLSGDDGLKFYNVVNYSSNSSVKILQFDGIPLSKSGSQFREFSGSIESTAGVPTIVAGTSLSQAFCILEV